MLTVFTPLPAGTVHLSVGTVTDRVALNLDGGPTSVRIKNEGATTAYYELGGSTVTAATATGIPLGSGECETVGLRPGVTHLAGICKAGSADLAITSGGGI